MKSIGFLALGMAMMAASTPVVAGGDSGRHHPMSGRSHWSGGHHGGFNWNQRPRQIQRFSRGWVMPRYWVAPTFYVPNWSSYGLAQPAYGYNWVRHYDDAYMVDPYGRVYDSVYGVDWDDDRYYDDRDGRRRSSSHDGGSGVAGAVVGGLAGGLIGNRIAGKGDRTLGTVLGAGIGAVGGAALDKAGQRGKAAREDERRAEEQARYDSYGYGTSYGYPADDMVTWNGQTVSSPPPPAYGAQGYCCGMSYPPAMSYHYAGPMLTTITVQSAPIVTTTTRTYITEEAISTAPKRTWKPKRRVKARPKPRCTCR